MRKTLFALLLATGAVGAATATAQAGYGYGHGYGHGYGYQPAYSYDYGASSYSYEPVCFYKKRKVHDGYGYYHYESFKVCH